MGCVLSHNILDGNISNNFANLNDLSLEFLIILKDHDFKKKKCCSLLKKIRGVTKKLPGNIHISSYENSKKYNIKGLILPYVLYMKLPKENIYVSSDTWEAEYFNSQTLELLKIFSLLGASDIKFKTSRDHNDATGIGMRATANLNAANIPLKMGAEIEHFEECDDSNIFDGQIKIKNPVTTQFETLEDFIDKNNMFYIKNNCEWQSLVNYKLQNNSITKMKFNIIFYKGFKYNINVSADLEALGISVSLFDSGSKFVKTTFEVRFGDELTILKSADNSSGGEILSVYI